MICEKCARRADKKGGCGKSCEIHGCSCQHKAKKAPPEPATGPAGE